MGYLVEAETIQSIATVGWCFSSFIFILIYSLISMFYGIYTGSMPRAVLWPIALIKQTMKFPKKFGEYLMDVWDEAKTLLKE